MTSTSSWRIRAPTLERRDKPTNFLDTPMSRVARQEVVPIHLEATRCCIFQLWNTMCRSWAREGWAGREWKEVFLFLTITTEVIFRMTGFRLTLKSQAKRKKHENVSLHTIIQEMYSHEVYRYLSKLTFMGRCLPASLAQAISELLLRGPLRLAITSGIAGLPGGRSPASIPRLMR